MPASSEAISSSRESLEVMNTRTISAVKPRLTGTVEFIGYAPHKKLRHFFLE